MQKFVARQKSDIEKLMRNFFWSSLIFWVLFKLEGFKAKKQEKSKKNGEKNSESENF